MIPKTQCPGSEGETADLMCLLLAVYLKSPQDEQICYFNNSTACKNEVQTKVKDENAFIWSRRGTSSPAASLSAHQGHTVNTWECVTLLET